MVGVSWTLGGSAEIELEDSGGDSKGGPAAKRSGKRSKPAKACWQAWAVIATCVISTSLRVSPSSCGPSAEQVEVRLRLEG